MKFKYKVANKSKYFGSTDTKKGLITINKKKSKATGQPGELLDSIVHETLHAKHPKMKETPVQKMTKRVIKKLSQLQKKKLYSKVK